MTPALPTPEMTRPRINDCDEGAVAEMTEPTAIRESNQHSNLSLSLSLSLFLSDQMHENEYLIDSYLRI